MSKGVRFVIKLHIIATINRIRVKQNLHKMGSCCKLCCCSTPYGTVIVMTLTLVGLVGFVVSALYGVSLLSYTDSLKNNTQLLGTVVGGVVGSSIIPLVLATILAYCTTGYVRDELYHPFIKTFVGHICSSLIILLTFLSFVEWLLMTLACSVVVVLYMALSMGCSAIKTTNKECGSITLGSFTQLSLCAPDSKTRQELCYDGLKIGISFTSSLGFCLLILTGLVCVLMIQAANFISVRESNKRSYRPNGEY